MQRAAVNEAFDNRCRELDDAKFRLEQHLQQVSGIGWNFGITGDLCSKKMALSVLGVFVSNQDPGRDFRASLWFRFSSLCFLLGWS